MIRGLVSMALFALAAGYPQIPEWHLKQLHKSSEAVRALEGMEVGAPCDKKYENDSDDAQCKDWCGKMNHLYDGCDRCACAACGEDKCAPGDEGSGIATTDSEGKQSIAQRQLKTLKRQFERQLSHHRDDKHA